MFSAFEKNQNITETLQGYISSKLSLSAGEEYSYLVVSKKDPSDVLIISSYPKEWVDLYRANKFQMTDPVVLSAFRRTSPFAWDENITMLSGHKFTKIFSLARQYDIAHGFTFVLHDQMNNLALLSIISVETPQNPTGRPCLTDNGAMQMLLIDFNEEMYRLAGIASADPDKLQPASGKDILTPRENEVLYWASMGKTYGETAAILGISVSTVKFHMSNIVNKFGVSNSRQAIRLSADLDLLTPVVSSAS